MNKIQIEVGGVCAIVDRDDKVMVAMMVQDAIDMLPQNVEVVIRVQASAWIEAASVDA